MAVSTPSLLVTRMEAFFGLFLFIFLLIVVVQKKGVRGKFVPYVDLQLTYHFSAPFLSPVLLLYLLIPSSDHPS